MRQLFRHCGVLDNASLRIALVKLIAVIPLPPPGPGRHDRPVVSSDRLVLTALIIMIVRHLATVHALLAVPEQPMPELQRLRSLLTEVGRYP